MSEKTGINISELNKDELIAILTEELPVLRAKIGLSQDNIAKMVGISRQTYSAVETKKYQMSWNTFLSLLFVFDNNEKTHEMLSALGAFPQELRDFINVDKR